jgi:putative membrane protein
MQGEQAILLYAAALSLQHRSMLMLALVLTALVAITHVYFLTLEMFLWKRPYGRRVFGTTPEQAEATAVLAANQGLYNGFLAAGLFWSLFVTPEMVLPLRTFFLGCVIVAGLYGGATASRRILFAQALPAALALAAVWLTRA